MYCTTIQRSDHISNETELHRHCSLLTLCAHVRLCFPEWFSLIANCRHWHINIPPPPGKWYFRYHKRRMPTLRVPCHYGHVNLTNRCAIINLACQAYEPPVCVSTLPFDTAAMTSIVIDRIGRGSRKCKRPQTPECSNENSVRFGCHRWSSRRCVERPYQVTPRLKCEESCVSTLLQESQLSCSRVRINGRRSLIFGSYRNVCYIRRIVRSWSATYVMSQGDWYQPRSHFAREDTEHG